MLSVDTNILFPAVVKQCSLHAEAVLFMASVNEREDLVLSEFILLELYGLLRNPAVLRKPLPPAQALSVCQSFRNHSHWQVLALPPDTRAFHDELWSHLGTPHFPCRRAYDIRTGLSLLHQGVREFATINVQDFQAIGFDKVWNPLKQA